MDEKRSAFRIPVEACLRYRRLPEATNGELQIQNISPKGLGAFVFYDKSLDVGSAIEIILDSQTVVLCKIVYSKIIHKETRKYGLEFIDKSQANIDALLAFCRKLKL